MQQPLGSQSFLEPVYLNEKMVLNCAAYLFRGYSLETDVIDQMQKERIRSVKAGIGFLDKLVSFGGERQTNQSEATENRSARRYTVGGLHMSLIDELRALNMLEAVGPEHLEEDRSDPSRYVEMPAILRPVDFFTVIDTLRTVSPIIGEVLTTFVRPWYERQKRLEQSDLQPALPPTGNTKQRNRGNQAPTRKGEAASPNNISLALQESGRYIDALGSVLQQLEDDYRRSKQLEMVMWTAAGEDRAYGVVDLDLGDYEPEELRAKLSGGTYRIVGKLTRVVREGTSIDLLEKSALYSVTSLFNRAVEALGENDGLEQYRKGLLEAKAVVEKFGLLDVRGPAVRVSAMSVCI